jgi:hypothetical protein
MRVVLNESRPLVSKLRKPQEFLQSEGERLKRKIDSDRVREAGDDVPEKDLDSSAAFSVHLSC